MVTHCYHIDFLWQVHEFVFVTRLYHLMMNAVSDEQGKFGSFTAVRMGRITLFQEIFPSPLEISELIRLNDRPATHRRSGKKWE